MESWRILAGTLANRVHKNLQKIKVLSKSHYLMLHSFKLARVDNPPKIQRVYGTMLNIWWLKNFLSKIPSKWDVTLCKDFRNKGLKGQSNLLWWNSGYFLEKVEQRMERSVRPHKEIHHGIPILLMGKCMTHYRVSERKWKPIFSGWLQNFNAFNLSSKDTKDEQSFWALKYQSEVSNSQKMMFPDIARF